MLSSWKLMSFELNEEASLGEANVDHTIAFFLRIGL